MSLCLDSQAFCFRPSQPMIRRTRLRVSFHHSGVYIKLQILNQSAEQSQSHPQLDPPQNVEFSPLSRPRKRKNTNSDRDRRPKRSANEESHALNVGDIEGIKAFYSVRFRELTMKPLRDIVTVWVKRLAPHRKKENGPYVDVEKRWAGKEVIFKRPPWWPGNVEYKEPSHLKLERKSDTSISAPIA
jgi:hypothetical protein